MKIAILGAGYVGLNTAAALAWLGHDVRIIDKDRDRIAILEQGRSPIHEPGLEALLDQCRPRLGFSTDTAPVADADLVFIAVGTPAGQHGEAHIGFVEDAAREVAAALSPDCMPTLVVKSTVPIGTGRRVRHVVERTLRERGMTPELHIASNPEFLREGTALHDTFYPDRIVVGAEDAATRAIMQRLYQPLLDQTFTPPPEIPRPAAYQAPPLVVTDPTSAEMIKYVANAFLAIKLSYINEIAALCERVGADIGQVAHGIGLDRRIGRAYLDAGPGWGGSCLPKDTSALLAVAQEYGDNLLLVTAAREVNQRQRQRIVEKLQGELKVLRGTTIGILGLAFKEGTDDLRDSPALDIIQLLLARGAHLRLHDPAALPAARALLHDRDVDFYDDPYALANGADALVLATPWPEYRELDLKQIAQSMRQPVLVDARNFWSADVAAKAGARYVGMGYGAAG
jgi:UDPglucose 6-dehydrogenase